MVMTNRPPSRRILVVEDEVTLAWSLERTFDEAGYQVIGPVGNVEQGMEAARQADISVALLDVNLRGQRVFPIASVLASRGIPFVFLTGYGSAAIPARFSSALTLAKPFRPDSLVATLDALCN
jgi:DNA-binding response OmpR family regulator